MQMPEESRKKGIRSLRAGVIGSSESANIDVVNAVGSSARVVHTLKTLRHHHSTVTIHFQFKRKIVHEHNG